MHSRFRKERTMAKYRISGSIKQNSEVTTISSLGIYSSFDRTLKWKDQETQYFLNLKESTLRKENASSIVTLKWDDKDQTVGTYHLKEIQKEAELSIVTKTLTMNETCFSVEYYLLGDEDALINFEVAWEEVE